MGIVIRLSYCQQQKIKNQKEWYRNNQMGIGTVNSIPTIRMALTLTYVFRCSLTQRGQVKTLCEVANYQQEIFLDQNIQSISIRQQPLSRHRSKPEKIETFFSLHSILTFFWVDHPLLAYSGFPCMKSLYQEKENLIQNCVLSGRQRPYRPNKRQSVVQTVFEEHLP